MSFPRLARHEGLSGADLQFNLSAVSGAQFDSHVTGLIAKVISPVIISHLETAAGSGELTAGMDVGFGTLLPV